MLHTGQIKEALDHIKFADEIFKKIRKSDPDNQETNLDELNFYNFKMKLLTVEKKPAEALKTINQALIKAQESVQKDPTNTEAISWVGYFSQEAKLLLIRQNRQSESLVYDNLYKLYALKFKEQSGNEWSGEFGF